jgi:hypothetical protein
MELKRFLTRICETCRYRQDIGHAIYWVCKRDMACITKDMENWKADKVKKGVSKK